MSGDYEKRMLRVLDCIHADPGADMSLDQLADVAAMSRFHWHRVFHGMTGETCVQAVRRVRMNRAACWLTQTDWPVAEIARRVGYPSVQSFARVFRAAYGMPPVAFRRDGVVEAPQLHQHDRRNEMFNVTIEAAPESRLATIAHRGPYLEIGGAFEKLAAIATARNLWPQVEGMTGIYLDDPNAVPEGDLRSFAGLSLRDGADVPEGLEEQRIEAGPIAQLRFKGPYSGLKEAYDYLFGTWLPGSGREPADRPSYEVYRNMPADTEPADLITDICLPLKS